MNNAIHYIIDNSYGDKFTITTTDTGETQNITREEAKFYFKLASTHPFFFTAKAYAQCRAVSCEKVS
jgi:hypothetical protein